MAVLKPFLRGRLSFLFSLVGTVTVRWDDLGFTVLRLYGSEFCF